MCMFCGSLFVFCTFSFSHCFVCSSIIYGLWLPLWYILTIVLSVLLWYTDSDYPFGIFWPLLCLFFYNIRTLITPLVYFGHCIVCSSMIYAFWLHPWYLLAIVLSVLLWYTDSDYPFVSFGHCFVCCSMINGFWLPLWYLQTLLNSIFGFTTRSDWFILCSHFKCII